MIKSIFIISDLSFKVKPASTCDPLLPASRLSKFGYHTIPVAQENEAELHEVEACAVVLNLSITAATHWERKLFDCGRLPVFWWCSPHTAKQPSAFHAQTAVPIVGILTPTMNELEIYWALQLGAKINTQRLQWQAERTDLLNKIEERKWIERAKGVLCQLKNISEAEAYEQLRIQAMNERKRIADVAVSIVNVYQMLKK